MISHLEGFSIISASCGGRLRGVPVACSTVSPNLAGWAVARQTTGTPGRALLDCGHDSHCSVRVQKVVVIFIVVAYGVRNCLLGDCSGDKVTFDCGRGNRSGPAGRLR